MHPLRLAIVALAGMALFPVSAVAQKQFEGRVAMRMMGDADKPQVMDTWVKGQKMRMDMKASGQTMSMIIDHGASRMTMLMPAMKMYMQRDLPAPEPGSSGDPKVTRTGRTDVVAGHKCEIIRIEDAKNGTSQICGATDMGKFVMGGRPGQTEPAWAKGMKGFFPLRVSDANGDPVLEVTKIEPMAVDASVFETPAGYKAMSVPGR